MKSNPCLFIKNRKHSLVQEESGRKAWWFHQRETLFTNWILYCFIFIWWIPQWTCKFFFFFTFFAPNVISIYFVMPLNISEPLILSVCHYSFYVKHSEHLVTIWIIIKYTVIFDFIKFFKCSWCFFIHIPRSRITTLLI